MHQGFKEFIEASLGTWHSENGLVVTSRAKESELQYLKSLHSDLINPIYCYKLEWKYADIKKKGSGTILAVDAEIEGRIFTSGMQISMPKKFEAYTKPLKMIYTASSDRWEWWTEDGVIRDLCYFVSENERVREFFSGKWHKVIHEKRMSMVEENFYWEKDETVRVA